MFSYKDVNKRREWVAHFQAGAGIVADSDLADEQKEYDGPSTHDGVSVNAAAPHGPSKGDDGPSTHDGGSVNAVALYRPFEGDDGPSTHEDPAAPRRTIAANPPLE
nr:anthranilate synthase alpha subunit 2, chloroplastic [Quercus suber]